MSEIRFTVGHCDIEHSMDPTLPHHCCQAVADEIARLTRERDEYQTAWKKRDEDAHLFMQRAEQAEREVERLQEALKARVLALAEEWDEYRGNYHPMNQMRQEARQQCARALREAVEGK